MPLWLDHGHGNCPLDLEGEKTPVVELAAVVADQTNFSPMNTAPSELEIEVVLDPAVGRDLQNRRTGVLGVVKVQLHVSLLGNFRCVEQFHGGPNVHTGHGHGRVQIEAGDGHVGFWDPIAVDEYYGNLLEFVLLAGLTVGFQFIRYFPGAQETLPGELLQVGNDIDLLIPGVGLAQ